VANGNPLKCQGRFENIHVLLQGIPFMLTLYALPLYGLDLVLEVQWLEQLGTVACDWKKMTMEFMWKNQKQKLQGIDSDRSLSQQVIKDKKQTQMYSALGENKPQLILLNIECPHSLSHSRV